MLSLLLGDFLSCEGNEDALDEWRTIPESTDGKLHSIHNGNVWKTIPGPGGQPFLASPSGDGELQIGVTLSLDW